ncbi:MAG: gamma-glutamyl-gamma-aminobutyrate hydrolase family protein [Firmicutes bacterium]|nr:gamma-glutamyl-gamma-aminobutyrate hydrolase family protein [Bacillota bacterium]
MVKSSPVIGVTSDCAQDGRIHVRRNYVEPLVRLDAVPLLVPAVESDYGATADALARELDGLLLTGGADIDPRYFGEDPVPGVYGISVERDEMEIALARSFLAVDKPILGICRGLQLLNVAAGGSLIQDIPSQEPRAGEHRLRRTPRGWGLHEVTISPGTAIERILGKSNARVNSRHHQAIKDVATGLEVTAMACDGVIIEAVESRSHRFVVAVQWHPEDLYPGEDSVRLFSHFIEACRGGRD